MLEFFLEFIKEHNEIYYEELLNEYDKWKQDSKISIQALLNDQISLKINGEIKTMSDATTGEREYPITYKDRTYIPLRSVATLLGMNVDS